jgi:NADH dehydrogenase FAD-containing subunit
MRILVLGGGSGGVATVRHLKRVLRRRTDVEITLVSPLHRGHRRIG